MHNKSKRHRWVAALGSSLAILCAASASEAAVITIGSSLNNAKGTTSVTIPVTISGGENISSISISFAAGDGGASGGSGVTNIPITAVSLAPSSIFTSASFTSNLSTGALPAASSTVVDLFINESGKTTIASGSVVNVTLNTTGIKDGGVVTLNGNFKSFSDLSNLGNPVGFSVNSGSGISVVPEPSYMALFATAGTMLVAFRRRRA